MLKEASLLERLEKIGFAPLKVESVSRELLITESQKKNTTLMQY